VNVGTRTLITVAEFEKLPDDGNLHELDEGELIVMPPPRPRHGRVQRAVAVLLDKATRDAGSGIVLTECGFRLAPDVVQAPDVAFIREERQAEIGTANSAPILQSKSCLPTIMRPDYNGRSEDISRRAPASCGYWTPIRSPSTYTRNAAYSEL
jgi:hypothetical protein